MRGESSKRILILSPTLTTVAPSFYTHVNSFDSMGAYFFPDCLDFDYSSRNRTKRSWCQCVGLTEKQETLVRCTFCGFFFCYCEIRKAFAVLFISATGIDSHSMKARRQVAHHQIRGRHLW